jgi:glycosyltransferase involved in cell wall biosynthesis
MMKRRTIVIVAHDVGPNSGMGNHLKEMITRLKSEMNVILVAASMNLTDRERQGIRFIRIPVIERPIPLKMLMFALIASFRLLFIKRDILHTTGAIVWNRADISTVHFCHAGYRKQTNHSRVRNNPTFAKKLNSWLAGCIASIMERLVYKPTRTKMLVAVSNRVRREILEHFPYDEANVRVVPNGVDLLKFQPVSLNEKAAVRRELQLDEEGRILLFMGGDWPLKGLTYVIEAFNKVASLHPDLRLVVVGRGSVPHYLEQVDEKFRHRVLFAGIQKNPEKWFAASDLFVFPSDYETFSLVVHEAAAAGLVVLASQVGGVEDLIEDGKNGIFVERDAHDIAIKLDKVLMDWQKKRSLGDRARDSMQNLTWDEAYMKMRRLYEFISQDDATRAFRKAVDLRSPADES